MGGGDNFGDGAAVPGWISTGKQPKLLQFMGGSASTASGEKVEAVIIKVARAGRQQSSALSTNLSSLHLIGNLDLLDGKIRLSHGTTNANSA
mmetsp:Transcript_33684/g.68876  ORF Transcript_33684/g.68876 Transcript_33684/m.68876 type:complete len:92 (-) Transcript_33684:21-296(-)